MKPYYEHAGITIYHGDCREILPQLSGVDLILADPPYGIKERTTRASNGRGKSVSGGFRFVESRDWPAVYGDDKPFDPAHLLPYPKVILWGANHYCDRLPGSSHWLIWDKREETGSDDNADCEIAWSNLPGPARLHRQLWRGICKRGAENVSIAYSIVHPTQKPLALMKWCIQQAGEVAAICDPYFGSGTTLRAAKDLGIPAIGIEIEEKYCEIVAKRLSQEVFNFKEGFQR
jgi:site-specific DNA-methyltransferase (adenine-specific)